MDYVRPYVYRNEIYTEGVRDYKVDYDLTCDPRNTGHNFITLIVLKMTEYKLKKIVHNVHIAKPEFEKVEDIRS